MAIDLLAPLVRLFKRNMLYVLLNIVGLAIGLAVCVLISLYVYNELSYDRQFANADRIVRINQVLPMQMANRNAVNGASSARLAPLVRANFADVEAVARFLPFTNTVRLQVGELTVPENGMRYAEAEMLRIFDFHWRAGDAASALAAPASLVLTAPLAEKLFGTTQALGRTVKVDGNRELTVTGVIDKPANTHLNFTALASMEQFDQQLSRAGMGAADWGVLFSSTYALLKPGARIADVQTQLDELGRREAQAMPPAPPGQPARTLDFSIDPLPGIYLAQTYLGGSAALSNLQRVQLFAAIGLCVLLIAVVNFMNLATAGGTRRAIEVGVKVALGASRGQLRWQFIGEALAMVAIALVLALALAELMLPVVKAMLNLDINFAIVPAIQLGLALAATVVTLGLLAGAYPAFYLTAWQPAKVLRGLLHRGKSGAWFRNVLVVAQFSASIALIVAALVMQAQLHYAENFDYGFAPEGVYTMTLPPSGSGDSKAETLITQLLAVPGVVEATQSLSSPRLEARLGSQVRTEDSSKPDQNITLLTGAASYLPFYHVRLLAGRYPGSDGHEDAVRPVPREGNPLPNGGVVINETAARKLGWTPAEAIGQTLKMPQQNDTMIFSPVIGVVADTMIGTRDDPLPMCYLQIEGFSAGFFTGVISIRLSPQAGGNALTQVRQVIANMFPGEIVQLNSLQDNLNAQYAPDRTQMQVFAGSALLAVAIACFGLFGLATFNTERRTKEIGVRKVMGGSVWSIVLLLTNDFSKLVLAANLIAWPVAYYAMNRWLQNFAYRIDLTPLIFIGSGLIALCIAWVTVGGTAAKAASQKPVLALRYE